MRRGGAGVSRFATSLGWMVRVGLVAGLVVAAANRDIGLWAWFELRRDLGGARERIEELELGNEMLRLELVGLEAGAWAVERAIREDLAFARPGEAVVRFSERPDRGANR